jgi:hypothetical protein
MSTQMQPLAVDTIGALPGYVLALVLILTALGVFAHAAFA